MLMRATCERCEGALPLDAETAYICSFECTFCEACTTAMQMVCPNCSRQLVRRPTRKRSVASVAASQVASRVRRLVGGS